MKSRRLRIVTIDEDQVLDWFRSAATGWINRPHVLMLPMIDGIPPCATVHEVRHNYVKKAFDFLLESETFSEVDPGSEVPSLMGVGMRIEAVDMTFYAGGPTEEFRNNGQSLVR